MRASSTEKIGVAFAGPLASTQSRCVVRLWSDHTGLDGSCGL